MCGTKMEKAEFTQSELLQMLADEYAGGSVEDLYHQCATDSVVPGICPACGYMIEVEPDCSSGWCEECEDNFVVSVPVLAGVI